MFNGLWYKTAAWKQKRRQRLKLANYRCESCGMSEGRLDLHHVEKYEDFDGFLNVPTKVLCFDCHASIHSPGRKYRTEALEAMRELE